jgi:hypothetical protein
MLQKFTHTFTKKLNQDEKESIFDFIKVKIWEDTKARFIYSPDLLRCEIPFFVSRWNPYSIFDKLDYTFDIWESENTTLQFETFHIRAICGKLWVGVFFGVLLWYTLPWEDVWKVSLYIFAILLYIVGLLWVAHRRTKRLFLATIAYAENL